MPLNRLFDSGQQIVPPPDVQHTTLGVDALSRFVCNTWDEATANGTRLFDAVVIGAGMFGGYCADKIFRFGQANGLKVLVLDAGAFLVPTHLQNLPNAGLNVPGPINPANDPGIAREVVWGIPWRGNVDFVGQAYCIGGKSLYWGGWCPRLLASDLAAWPPTVAQYLTQNYALLEQQTGADIKTDFIQGPLFTLLKQRVSTLIQNGSLPNVDTAEDPPLAVQGQAPASGLFSFDKYSSATVLIEAARDAAGQPDSQRRLFVVPNAHVTHLNTANGAVSSIDSRNRDGLGTTYHEAGTLWMGTSPQNSVTDTNGRFHNVANAFCADQSLFVTVGSVNPTLTGLVLSRKVAQAAVALATGVPPP